MKQTYPIISIYATIQGQGPRMGEPMTLIRTSTPKAFSDFCYMKSTRATEYKELTVRDIVKRCEEIGEEWVFLGGDDPCISNIDPLVKELQTEGFKVWLDTTGVFYFANPDKIDHLSLGPKPLLPYNPKLLGWCKDIRLYYRDTDPEIWENVYNSVVAVLEDEGLDIPIFIAPRVLTQSCIDTTIKFMLRKKNPSMRVDIPLFRTLPNFDKNFNSGDECPICHLMDEFQGCKVEGIK